MKIFLNFYSFFYILFTTAIQPPPLYLSHTIEDSSDNTTYSQDTFEDNEIEKITPDYSSIPRYKPYSGDTDDEEYNKGSKLSQKYLPFNKNTSSSTKPNNFSSKFFNKNLMSKQFTEEKVQGKYDMPVPSSDPFESQDKRDYSLSTNLENEKSLNSHNSLHKSITQGKVKTSPKNLTNLLHHEFDDVSVDLNNKITNTIQNMHSPLFDPHKYKEVIVIRKRILQDGKRKIVNLNVSEHVVPKEVIQSEEEISRDFGLRALLGGIVFLLAGLVFTSTVKMYQQYVKKRYIKINSEEIK
ncbi:hypothetical protein CWI36_0391p0030 [Hamiltosporidium magnivora]|uniref:Uncharacterized protein n=1 Tax=Hamiltosporidium magnivora TaxID=148818 RepID=A0A4Q9L7S2_9MICR|nr:hypothetical protein CWI36_0876p0010 [Hamiltosporidium magnivora]TBU06724.1 hypothetical protein CWI36_0391p0030 [Hamiltosporidium magnivora]